jgi:hypothetical protein
MADLAELTLVIRSEAVKAANQALEEFDRRGKFAEHSAMSFEKGVDSLIGKVKHLALELIALETVHKAFESAAGIEKFRLSLEAAFGSAEAGKKIFKELIDLADKSPFDVGGLAESAKQMKIMGFEGEHIIPILRTITDGMAALGKSESEVQAVVGALGRIRAKAEEGIGFGMRALVAQGIPAWQMLADKIGVTVPQAIDLVEKKMIKSDTVIEAIVDGINTRFGGMGEKMAETLGGLEHHIGVQLKRIFTLVSEEIAQSLDLKSPLNILLEGLRSITVFLVQSAGVATGNAHAMHEAGIAAQIFGEALRAVIVTAIAWKALNLVGSIAALDLEFGTLRDVLLILRTTMNTHPLFTLAAILGVAASALISLRSHFQETTAAADEMKHALETLPHAMDDYTDSVARYVHAVFENDLERQIEEKRKQLRVIEEAKDELIKLQNLGQKEVKVDVRGGGSFAPGSAFGDKGFARWMMLNKETENLLDSEEAKHFKEMIGKMGLDSAVLGGTLPRDTRREVDRGIIETATIDVDYVKISALIEKLGKAAHFSESQIEKMLAKLSDTARAKSSMVDVSNQVQSLFDKIDKETTEAEGKLGAGDDLAIQQAARRAQAVAALSKILSTPGANTGQVQGFEMLADLDAKLQKLEDIERKVSNQKKARDATTDMAGLNAEMDNELNLISKTNNARERAEKLTKFQKAAIDSLADSELSEADRQKKVNQMVDDYDRKLQTLQKHRELVKLANEIGDAFGDAFTDMLTGAKSVQQAIEDLTRSIFRMIVQQTVAAPIARAISSGLIGAFTPAATKGPVNGPGVEASVNRLGNIFDKGNVMRFAAGGIVDGDTYFPMSRGRFGLMGEDGPEAVMPLERGSNGKLGLRGGPAITNHYHTWNIRTPDAGSFKRSRGQIAADMQSVGVRAGKGG